jgi:hypothetical protein
MPPSQSLIQIWTSKIKNYGQLSKPIHFIKIIIGYAVIITIGLSPMLVSFMGATIEHTLTGKQINEGNSIFGAVIWLMFYTIPFGFVLLIFWTSIVVKSVVHYLKQNR